MILNWRFYDVNHGGDVFLSEFDINKLPATIYSLRANFGIFEVSIDRLRKYKDGTYQWGVYFRCPYASSKEIITLTKVRGLYLADVTLAAEDFLFAHAVYPNKNN